MSLLLALLPMHWCRVAVAIRDVMALSILVQVAEEATDIQDLHSKASQEQNAGSNSACRRAGCSRSGVVVIKNTKAAYLTQCQTVTRTHNLHDTLEYRCQH